MGYTRKLVWAEGMRITPHHFQQWDHYVDDQITARVQSLTHYGWGIGDLRINREAIANGQIVIERLTGLLPDGMWIQLPESEPCPPVRNFKDVFPPTEDHLDVYLAIPSRQPGTRNFQLNGQLSSQPVRFRQVVGTVVDETRGEGEIQLGQALGNYQILIGSEVREGFSALKIGVITRSATGQFILDEQFIPPLIDSQSSDWLRTEFRKIIEVLITKSSSLGDQRRQGANSLVDFTALEASAFWLLHTINGAIPKLKHLYVTRAVHPERLYTELAGVIGQLMTFAPLRHPKDVVAYDHTDLRQTFSRLFADLRDLLEIVISTRCVAIPLTNVRESVYVGRVEDERLLQEASFFLAIRSQMPEREAIVKAPRMIKVAASDHIDRVIGVAMPGVPLNYAAAPPGPIPTRPGFVYFGLETVGRFWDVIRGSKSIGIYVPNEFPEVKLELYAVKP